MTVVDSKNAHLEQVGGGEAAGKISMMTILRILTPLPLITILKMMAGLMTLHLSL